MSRVGRRPRSGRASAPRRLGTLCVLTLLAVFLPAPQASADTVPPVRIQVKEVAEGSFEVQWSVPKVMAPRNMPSPRLPEGCRVDGAPIFFDRPSGWLTRQSFRCPDGISGQTLGVGFPDFNVAMSTVLRVDLLSGERYAHMLNPGEDSWQVPEHVQGGLAGSLATGRDAVWVGVTHFFGGWTHLAFLFVLCLLGGITDRVRLATTFFLAQLAAAVAGTAGLRLDLPLAEIGVALATALLAREALRPSEERRQVVSLAAGGGFVHGLGLADVAAQQGQAAPSLVYLLLVALGVDAALLVVAAALGGVGRLVPASWARPTARTAGVYAVAGLAIALALASLAVAPPITADTPKLTLAGLPGSASSAPASRRVAAAPPDAAIQSFVAIEAFEVRHEVLVRPRLVADLLGIGAEATIEVESQEAVKQRASELVAERSSFQIDGRNVEASSRRVDFLTFDDQGALPRPLPVPELVESAWLGVSTVYFTEGPPLELELAWRRFDVDSS